MSTPSTLIIGSINGLVVLDDRSQTLDPDGTVRAVVRYVCYPPNEVSFPAYGSAHPRYNGLTLKTRDVRMDGPFAFIDAEFVGVPRTGQISTESESHSRVGWWLGVNDDGSMGYKRYKITNTTTRQTFLTTGGAPASTPGSTVSYTTEGGITRYTVETVTEERVEVPE